MDHRITAKQLKALLGDDFDRLLEEVAEAMNQARPGHIIDDSEERVRDVGGEFRRRLFERALELRSQGEAFSPSGQREQRGGSLAE